MENREYWLNSSTVLVSISTNNRIGVILYYGSARQYSIKTSENLKGDESKQVKSILSKIKEEKKYITPIHGCTHYL